MIRTRRNIEFIVVAGFVLCAWILFNTHPNDTHERFVATSAAENQWQDESTDAREEQRILVQKFAHGGLREETTSTSTTLHRTRTLAQSTTTAPPSPSLPDRIVVMAKLPSDDTSWVHSDLPDWQSAIYAIDISTPHNTSTLNPLTNSTLRTLRNKGREANAYLAYIVQNYDSLPSTIAFIHPHKDGYPAAWHTDNDAYSNAISLRSLNTHFVQSNGYANLRCAPDPGCPAEIMPFRDPPEAHRTAEAAMPDAWRELFNDTDVPAILATPCCAQFAVSREQVRKREAGEYKRYYRWLMETPLDDATSGRVFEYLWHVLFGREAVYCPALETCSCDVYGKCP